MQQVSSSHFQIPDLFKLQNTQYILYLCMHVRQHNPVTTWRRLKRLTQLDRAVDRVETSRSYCNSRLLMWFSSSFAPPLRS